MNYTGPSIATRNVVWDRCAGCCELCGRWAKGPQVHHRRPRGMGGTSDPGTNRPSNLVLLCADCHGFLERGDRAAAREHGWLVDQGQDPSAVPYLLWGRWVFLSDLGEYLPVPDEELSEVEPF